MSELNNPDLAGGMDSSADENAAGEAAQRIGDVAAEYGISLRTLRFYEDKGLLTPQRVGSTRLYHRRDISRLKLILLGRQVGFSLREVKQILDLYDREGSNTRQNKLLLDRSAKQMRKLQKQREEIDGAIDALNGLIARARAELESTPAGKSDKI